MTELPKYVLITGGAGFIGSHLVDRCLAEGYDVTILDNLCSGCEANFRPHTSNPHFHFIHHDIKNPLPVDLTLRPPGKAFSLIFHLACPASPVHYQHDPISTTLTCVNGTYHLLTLAVQMDCPILIASTSEVYGDPTLHPQPEEYWGNVNFTGIRSCYDEGKRCAESLCFDFHRRYGAKIRVARIFNTYGPRMCFDDGRIVSNFMIQALRGDDITIYGTGAYTRSFQYIDDLIEGFWRLVHHPSEIGPVNLGNTEEYTVKEMGEKIVGLLPGSKSKLTYLPGVSDDPKQRRPDNSKAKRVLGWEPKVKLDEGLRRTLEEFKSRL
ncbi:unnamed protein product [Phytomonas sp. Hart1]|nr:unnamed protein product [Phytomonas sp. Hart1]|eukprot:CCW68000.1 unnamed protein product [Phytomonas sp. isolate Hart1]